MFLFSTERSFTNINYDSKQTRRIFEILSAKCHEVNFFKILIVWKQANFSRMMQLLKKTCMWVNFVLK